MRFLIDAQLPPSLAATLREYGQDADHVFALLPANAPDTAIWNLAIGSNFVLVTKDEDFAEWSRLRSIPCAPRSDGAAHCILRWPDPLGCAPSRWPQKAQGALGPGPRATRRL